MTSPLSSREFNQDTSGAKKAAETARSTSPTGTRALAPDDFAAKHLVNVDVDTPRRSLADMSNAESASTLTNWAGRAGRKGAHTRDDRLEAAKAAIVSPIEGGSAGGSSA